MRNVASKLIQLVTVLLGISILAFVLLDALPVDPAVARAGPLTEYTLEERQAIIEQIREQMGLDKPLPVRYWLWLVAVFRGDFGRSLDGQPVMDIVSARLPPTLELGLLSIAISLVAALVLAIWAHRTRWRRARALMEAAQSSMLIIPSFWFGILLILLFAVQLRLLPTSGYVPWRDDPAGHVAAIILPTITLAVPQVALFFRYLLSGLDQEGRSAYVTAARARGLGERSITYRHVLPNGGLPSVTVIGMMVASVFGGLVVVEQVFSWPGTGMLLLQSIEAGDANTLTALVLLTAAAFVVMSALVDILYILLDPRLRTA